MTETFHNNRYNPCRGCPDCYLACSDHCQKSEYLEWKAEQEKIREAKKAYKSSIWQYPEASVKHKFGRRRKYN